MKNYEKKKKNGQSQLIILFQISIIRLHFIIKLEYMKYWQQIHTQRYFWRIALVNYPIPHLNKIHKIVRKVKIYNFYSPIPI